MSDHEHYVYRCYDATGRLLYVGCTQDVTARMQVHACDRGNPASVVVGTRTTHVAETAYPNKAEAQRAEREAIYDEAPLANLHHQRVRETPADRQRRLNAYLAATRPTLDTELSARVADALAGFGRAS